MSSSLVLTGDWRETVELDIPGIPERGGSDHMSFICRGTTGFRLQSHYPDYRQYTWHTDIDTFSANDELDRYRREFRGPVDDWVALYEPADEGSSDPEAMSNWRRISYIIEKA